MLHKKIFSMVATEETLLNSELKLRYDLLFYIIMLIMLLLPILIFQNRDIIFVFNF